MLDNARRKTGKNSKLCCPTEGPYLVIVLFDKVNRIWKSRRTKPNVIVLDELKPYLGPLPRDRFQKSRQLSNLREEGREASDVDTPVLWKMDSVRDTSQSVV